MRLSTMCVGCLVLVCTLPAAVAEQPSCPSERAAREELAELKQFVTELSSRIESLEQKARFRQTPEKLQVGTVTARVIYEQEPEEIAQTGFEPRPEKVGKPRLVLISYKVEDLIEAREAGEADRNFDPLIRYISTKIAPEHWEAKGGPGTMAPYQANGSLVVSASSEVHQKISDWLKKMREAHEVLADFESTKPTARE